MKNKLYIALAITIFLPNFAFAAWWNPLSWGIFHRLNNNTQTQEKRDDKATSTIVVATTIEKNKVVKKDVVVNDARSILIAQFLKDPTLDNFKIFCASAKNVEGNRTKQILDSNREKMVAVKLSLYDEMTECKKFDTRTASTYYLPLDNSLLIAFKNDDSDWLREIKIRYNDKVKSLIDRSKIKFVRFAGSNNIYSPQDLFQSYVDTVNMKQGELTYKDKIELGVAKNNLEKFFGKITDLSDYFQ